MKSTAYNQLARDLVGPEDDEFSVYGDKEIIERARDWAKRNQLFLVQHATCAHDFYLVHCPSKVCVGPAFDHVTVWISWPLSSPFLLSHIYGPYDGRARDQAEQYAAHHGLKVWVDPPDDSWYQNGTTTLRFDAVSNTPLPLEWMTAGVFTLWPPQRDFDARL